MASVTYYTAAGQAAFTEAATVGLPVWEPMFPEQSAKLAFRQRFWQTAADWTPVALNTLYPAHGQYGVPTSASYYLVSEGNFADERGGMLSWDREYATIPSVRYDFHSLAFRFPAIYDALSIGAFSNVAAGEVAAAGSGRMYVKFSGAAPGDRLVLSYQIPGTTTVNRIAVVPVREYAANGSTTYGGIIVDSDSTFLNTSTTSRQVARATATAGRQLQLDAVGRATVKYSYTLCAAGAPPAFSFQTRQKFTRNGEEVDYVSSGTVPNSISYFALVAAGTTFRVCDDEWERWRGNIFEIRETGIAAQ